MENINNIMTAEEFLNQKEYNPAPDIQFEDYNGDLSYSVQGILIDFARYHVTKALNEVKEKAYGYYYEPGEISNPEYIKVDHDSVDKAYSLYLIE